MIVKQFFEIITNEKHKNMEVLLRVEIDNGDTVRKSWEDYGARIAYVESDDKIVLNLKDGAMVRVDREAIKLKR